MNKIIFSLISLLLFSVVPTFALEYDFSEPDSVKIPLRITEKITTAKRNKSYESQPLNFIVDKDVIFDGKVLVKKGTPATARLEIMTTRGFAGIPAEIFITDFSIPELDDRKFMEPVSRRGFSTTTLIVPIKIALTPFPPFGSITNIFIGGNASLTPRRILKVEYCPNFKFAEELSQPEEEEQAEPVEEVEESTEHSTSSTSHIQD